jgi:hypothetical protein
MARSALGTQSFVGAMRGGLMAHGLSARLADQAAFSMLMQAARQQVAVLSYADLFYLCLVIVMIGFLPIPFMGTRPAK